MKIVVCLLIVGLLLLQYSLWVGDGSVLHVYALKNEVALQQQKVKQLKERNQTLEAEVQDLKNHLSALEEHARTDLGMIRQGETFYQYSTKPNHEHAN